MAGQQASGEFRAAFLGLPGFLGIAGAGCRGKGECVCRWCVCQLSREGDDEAALPLVAPVWRVAHTVLWLSRELGSLECDDGHWAGHLTGEDKKGRGSK